MSTNELYFDKSNQMLQSERNCVNFDGTKRFNVNYKAMSHDDKCFIDIDTRQSIGEGNYQISNYFDCECMIPQTVKHATDNVCIPFKNGYGTEQACVVDDGSNLRWGLTRKYPKCSQRPLLERPYKSIPFMGRGPLKEPNDETFLIQGEDTRVKKSCNTLSGVTVPNYFTPLLPYLEFNIQRDIHLIEEVGLETTRSGYPSRLVVRDFDLKQRCGKNYQYAYMNKSTNPEFWQNKGQLLQNQ